jgi:RNA polymerase sigma-70 factor (ECF subfamily)
MPATISPSQKRAVSCWLDDPDVQLMLRVRDGDGDGFAELVGRYRPRVHGYLRRQVGNRAEVEDLTQEVFLRLYRSRFRYQPRACFATWVFHVAHNVARNALRTRRRRPCLNWQSIGVEDRPALEALAADRSTTPSRPLERAELSAAVRSAVAELAGRQRTAVELHQFQERSYAEVAAELNMTAKAAKSLLYRARQQLRLTLTPLIT